MQIFRPWSRILEKIIPGDKKVEPKPLFSLLTETAKKFPKKVCIYYQGSSLTYSQVDEMSSRFASFLLSSGIKKGDRVAIFLPNIPQFIISYFGILKAGAIVVTCSPLYKERELEYQLKDSGSKAVVAAVDVVRGNDLFKSLEACRDKVELKHVIAASVTDFLPPIKKRLATLAGIKKKERSKTTDFLSTLKYQPLENFESLDPVNDIAVLQYTGGTTGIAKGAMLSHYSLYSNAAYVSMWVPMNEMDVTLAVLPLYHIYGMTACMNATLYSGGEIVLLPSFHVKDVMKTIQKRNVTIFPGVPSMYIAIINSPEAKKYDLSSLRGCVSGGAALPPAVRKKFIEITRGNLVEGYGLTEASPVTHCNPVHDGEVRDGSIGIPFPETDAIIVDVDNPDIILKPGEVGELAVRGPQVMKGYWNMPEETSRVLRNGWLLTGDIAKMDEDGYFYIVDRKKDMINVGGLKVYPREVEDVIFEHPAVKEAAVIGMPDTFRGEVVKAYVVLKENSKATESEIIDFCSSRLAKYKVPVKVEFVKELPKTLVGKVLRRKLKEEAKPQQS
jgi:long-chain acyl-CoA synthetase